MRTARPRTSRRTADLTRREVKKFPRQVAEAICDLVNNHAVPFRLLDGTHILLYPLDGTSRPFKVSAHRPATASMHFIEDFRQSNHLEEP